MTTEGIIVLVLTRKLNQSITLGNPKSGEPPLEVTVIEVRGDQVRLGITAPKDVAVHRKEVYTLIQEENQAASRTQADARNRTYSIQASRYKS